MKPSIVLTAFGAITPIGSDYATLYQALKEGKSGIKEIKKFNVTSYTTKHAGIPDEGNINNICQETLRGDFVGEMFYADKASQKLRAHPNFPSSYYDSTRIGCIVGVDRPEINIMKSFSMFLNQENYDKNKLYRQYADRLKLSELLNLEPTSVLKNIYKNISFSGYSVCHMGLCSASLQAIGMGMHAIQNGIIDAAIVGGVSSKITPVHIACLEHLGVISKDQKLLSHAKSRPFDSKRSGFVPAEGSVMFFIEKESAVDSRGGEKLLRLLGYGDSLSAQHIVIPHTESKEMILSMERAMKDSGLSTTEIDYVNAHGTSTILNDLHESEAIRTIFKDKADILVTANKSIHGHMIASAGAMEVLNTLISIKEGFIPGTINVDRQDKKIHLNIVKSSTIHKINAVLKNSFGMGGLASSLVLQKV